MQQPNWFDERYGKLMEHMAAPAVLELIAKDATVLKAVQDALDFWDSRPDGWAGPSRSQSIRNALCQSLNG